MPHGVALITIIAAALGLALVLGFRAVRLRGERIWHALAITLIRVPALIALMLVVGRRILPAPLWQVARTRSRELVSLCVIAAAVRIA